MCVCVEGVPHTFSQRLRAPGWSTWTRQAISSNPTLPSALAACSQAADSISPAADARFTPGWTPCSHIACPQVYMQHQQPLWCQIDKVL